MTRRTLRRILSHVALLAGVASAPIAQGETVDCTPITTLPATISTQGIYCLTGNLAAPSTFGSGHAITIDANNVTLDLNGWKLGGQAAGAGTLAIGIYSLANNVTVKNGIVRGFYYGVLLGGRGAVVRDVLADQSTHYGVFVYGDGAVIEHNQVVDTGGSTSSSSVGATGIYSSGNGVTISNNIVTGVAATGGATEWGIEARGDSTVRDNTVSDTARPPPGGTSVGIFVPGGSIVNNTVSNFLIGIDTNAGIYAHNTVNNCATNYYGGTAGADNSP